SIKNDGHYFCRAGGNRPDGLNEPVTLMTSFDVQQHHGAARHFTSVSAIAQEQIFPNWDMPANCW
ncbi:hypothetical protein, partial [Escherichia coli]|uniref:hypothetical protein n=1 Tax=Escherichia coli TaxID=562 RepID=UPI001E2865AD